jgi:hypothetical protein
MKKSECLKHQEKEEVGLDFQKDLSIDKYSLDRECVSHSSLYFKYAEKFQEAKNEVSKMDDKLKLLYAEKNIEVREKFNLKGVKTTEAMITAELEKDSEIIEMKNQLREMQKTANILGVGVQAMEARKSQLDNLVKLFCAGYYSTNTAPMTNNAMEINSRIKLNTKE